MNTILTGIRTNSDMTLGNYLGALLPMTRLANKHSQNNKINIFVPDLHTIIADIDGDLQQNITRSIKYYLASGLKLHQNIHIYRQSRIPAHSELAWLLDCFATMGEMNRMTQWKDKKGQDEAKATVGIFNYPVLMAADILLYDADYIPVGADQFQHIELTRNLAERVNRRLQKDIFTIPKNTEDQVKFMEIDEGLRIRDLQNPEKKMSKSAKSDNSKIMMSDDPKLAAKKIMSATTDSIGKIKFDMFNQPGISNLLQIQALLEDRPLLEVVNSWVDEDSYGKFKTYIANLVQDFLGNFQAKVAEVEDQQVLELLRAGEIYANTIANKKLHDIQKLLHLR